MLHLSISPQEYYNENKCVFYYAFPWAPNKEVSKSDSFDVQMEHSLFSLSRWEEKWKVPFLSKETEKNIEQTLDYIRCMTITRNIPNGFYESLSQSQVNQITEYITDSHTATWFSENDPDPTKKGGKPQVITAEIIYYWMIAQQIPWDPCEKWHLNKLLTLIRVCSIKNTPPKKKSKQEANEDFRRAKAARRAATRAKAKKP